MDGHHAPGLLAGGSTDSETVFQQNRMVGCVILFRPAFFFGLLVPSETHKPKGSLKKRHTLAPPASPPTQVQQLGGGPQALDRVPGGVRQSIGI